MSIIVEHVDGVTQLTLNRPEAANAVTVEMALEIAAAIGRFAADENARVLVITGAGERSFCAGGDICLVCSKFAGTSKMTAPAHWDLHAWTPASRRSPP